MPRLSAVMPTALLAWILVSMFTASTAHAKITLLTANPQDGQPLTFSVAFDNCLSGNPPDSVSWGLRFSRLEDATAQTIPWPAIGAGKQRAATHDGDVDTEQNAYAEIGITPPNTTIQVTTTLPAGRYHPRVLYGCYNSQDTVGTTAEITEFAPYEFVVAGPVTTPSRDPIIFVPGMMGSRLACGGSELWFSIRDAPLERLALQSDGATDVRGACSRPITSVGVLDTALGVKDVYGEARRFLTSYGEARGRNVYSYHYDWRRSPEDSVAGLQSLIDVAKRESGSSHVMIVAHSMGGLVTQSLLRDPTRAASVSRVITVGTPYWGAPKSWLPVSHGWTSPDTLDRLDMLFDHDVIKRISRNMAGNFSLLPSARYHSAYGNWLSMSDGAPLSGGARRAAPGGLAAIVQRVGANGALAIEAQQMHARRLDGFMTNGVDYHVIVGAGETTVTSIDDSLSSSPAFVTGDGDGTVPLLSQTQGGVIGTTNPAGDAVTVSRVCGVQHGSQMSDAKVLSVLALELHSQERPPGSLSNCEARGRQATITVVPNASAGVMGASSLRTAAASTQQPLPTAIRAAQGRGDLQVLPGANGSYQIVTSTRAALELPVSAGAIVVTPLIPHANGADSRGVSTYFAPPAGTTTIRVGASGAAPRLTHGGRSLPPVRADRRAPTVRAVVTRAGRFAIVRFTATDASKRTALYVQAGPRTGFVKLRGATYRIATAKLATVRFYATDRFNNATPPRALPKR